MYKKRKRQPTAYVILANDSSRETSSALPEWFVGLTTNQCYKTFIFGQANLNLIGGKRHVDETLEFSDQIVSST